MFKVEEGIRFWGLVTKIFKSLRYDKHKDIDGADALGERLFVRGKNLNDLIGNITFTEAIFHVLLHRMPNDVERKLLDAVLVSFHAGFGYSTPSVLMPRLAATTGTSVAGSLAAGYSASGSYHVGATEEVMTIFEDIIKSNTGNLEEHTTSYLKGMMASNKKIYGFGHPLFKKDPRPPRLRALLKELDYTSDYIRIYDIVGEFLAKEKNIHPNIDGINGAILLSLGLKKDHGTGLFLLARTSAMLAHVVDERGKEPFYSERRLYPILRLLEKERD